MPATATTHDLATMRHVLASGAIAMLVVLLLASSASPLTSDPTGTISIDKVNTADGSPGGDSGTVQPGESFTYDFVASCSNIEVDCVNLTVTDTFPDQLVVDESTLPAAIAGFREVSWDGATLTVTYVESLANPPGSVGKLAGTSDPFSVSVTLPADTPLPSGTEITNEATIAAANVAETATDPTVVTVDIPRVVDVSTTKSFSDPSAIAGDPDATTTIQLGADNLSTSSARVSELVVDDSTPDTWEYLDVVAVTVTQFPAGADQAQLFVCPEDDAPCTDDADWVAGGSAAPPGPASLAFPGSVPADQVVGVRVVFSSPLLGFIAPVADGGTAGVEVDAELRDTVRSTDEPIDEIPTTTDVDNVVSATVTDPGADPTTATATDDATFQILPPTLSLDTSKTFFADANGNHQTDPGEHAVIGEPSGVSMDITAQNTSAFPIAEIVITEPAPAPPSSELDKVDITSILLTFPSGAANANVVVTYDDATSTSTDHAPPGPTTIDLGDPPPRVTSVTVTYTGPDDDGDGNPDATIIPDATAGLGVHGNLNDQVDESDVGSLAGIDNCAAFTGSGGGIPGSTGSFAGTSCTQLPIEERDAGTGGTKVPSQGQIPEDQPVVFDMTTTNNGNLPLIDLVVSDPVPNLDGSPPVTPVFEYGRFLSADVQPPAMASRVAIEVYTPDGGWALLDLVDGAAYPDVIGVRASIDVLQPTESFDLRVGMIARDPLPPGPPPETITNCYGVTAAGDDYEAQVYCGPPIFPAPVDEAAVINKAISPESMPRRIPGMEPQSATVTLEVRNSGDITAQMVQVTDVDADFWDAVDLVELGTITPPAVGELDDADQIQVDAFVDGAWVDGVPTAIGSAALPAGVTPAEVRGLRFTFTDSSTVNDGFVLTPCADATCTGVVEFQVVPRLSLLSTGAPLPEVLVNSATGAFTTRLHPDPDDPALIDEVTDDLLFVPGDPRLDVDKSPESATLQPGQIGTFDLVTTNDGTANLPDLTVSDPVPVGLHFDETYADPDSGQPFTVTWSNLPDGYPEPPAAVFAPTPDPDDLTRVGLLRWTFPDWDMPPNASVTIFIRYTLEPGVTAGQEITNTMGASSPVDGLECTDPDGVVVDGEFGDGTYCTDPAEVGVTAGTSFASRKWVAGNPDLGWYNASTGELVPVGGGGCLSLSANGRTYTTNPCIAIVDPGEQFHYVLRVQNAGTDDALEMVIVDTFPAPGDTGVLGAERETEWATAPTLSGPATYTGPTTGTISYTSGAACIDDLFLDGPPCPVDAWDGAPGPDTTALRLMADFQPDPLGPGGTIDVSFSMDAPAEVPRVADPTIAWNSIAHAERTELSVLPPLEPLKVGVAVLYGSLEVVKEIGDNPADLPVDDLTYTFGYECTLSNGDPAGSGSVTATPATPGVVTGIAAGSTCEVWETATNGGIPSATEDDPIEVVIDPSVTPDDPVLSSVTVTNDFPLAAVAVVKVVGGGPQDQLTGGPYLVTVGCTYDDEPVTGFPIAVELLPDDPVGADLPVGTTCTFTEQDVPDAAEVAYTPSNVDGTAAEIVVPADSDVQVSVEILNTFATGSLVVRKEVSGPGAPAFSQGPFTFDVTCVAAGTEAQFSTVVTVAGSTDGSPVDSEPITGLPIGAVCTVSEADRAGADRLAAPVTVTIEEDVEAEATIAVLGNPYSAATISVTKEVQGIVTPQVGGIRFTIGVECAVERDGEVVPVLDAVVTAAGDGEPVLVTGADDAPALAPLGARCWAEELDGGGATSVEIDHDSYATGAAVVASDDLQELRITVVNTFSASDGALPRTGSGAATPLTVLGAALLVSGASILAASRVIRRFGPATKASR